MGYVAKKMPIGFCGLFIIIIFAPDFHLSAVPGMAAEPKIDRSLSEHRKQNAILPQKFCG